MSIQPAMSFLFFVVPVAAIALSVVAAARSSNFQDPSSKRRVVWTLPVFFTLAILSTAAGTLFFVRLHGDNFSLALANSVVVAALYMELSFCVLYLLSVITTLAVLRPVKFLFYCILITAILISATLVYIIESFQVIWPLLSPILYLALTILTLPVIGFSFLSTVDHPRVFLAPQILVSSPSYPRLSIEKPRLSFVDEGLSTEESCVAPVHPPPIKRAAAVFVLCGQTFAIIHFGLSIAFAILVSDQPPPLLASALQETVGDMRQEALAFEIAGTAFLVLWMICTMMAFLPSRLRRRPASLATVSEVAVTAFTDAHLRRPRIKLKSLVSLSVQNSTPRSSPFSTPAPNAIPDPLWPKMPAINDLDELQDPFALKSEPVVVSLRTSQPNGSTNGPRQPRMSAWGTLPVTPPPTLQVYRENVGRLPSLRALGLRRAAPSRASDTDAITLASKRTATTTGKSTPGRRRSMSVFTGYTSPSEYSQVGEGDAGFDMEEALLAQKLLQRLDAASNTGNAGPGTGRWARRA
ncbi:hypothetical protein MIND_00083000 [Mycena indigotica]|uniref:Uncharacterized protein n=1 Tax=Mycena indigotica TaxID=2126181 RepID=A0A8H6WEF9_9AGAR|nr:uncharacterized protein MIND_00083000 [Mycena indigotica]KAF7315674.1 hypothetical protein MIND_00083000 [Mycena indigotica]